MADPVVFYTHPMSRGRTVHWMLEEIGAPYRVQLLRFDENEHKAPAYLAINPMGKVPAIVHRGVVVTETAAICAYLADAFPHAGLAPAIDDPARGTYLRWLFFAAGCLEPAMVDRRLDRSPGTSTGIGYGTYDDTVNTLEKALTPGPFILGERFSAADVYICSHIGWGTMTNVLEPRPTFQRYSARCGERPAFQRFNAAAGRMAPQ